MGASNLSGPLYVGGVPTMGSPGSLFTTGNVFFVDSGATNTSDGNAGTTKGYPLATIDAAVGKCTANNGDVIIVMPGHAEVVIEAGGLDLDVAGISIIGVGRGTDTPTVTFTTATTADVDVDAANVLIENINFVAGIADQAIMIDVNATDCTIRNCRFTQSAVDLNSKICIEDALLVASNNLIVEGCYANMYDAANTHFLNMVGTGDGYIIRDNVLCGDWGTMCIGGAGLVTNCAVLRNYIYNVASDADACINMGATATGILAGNMCAGGHATDGIVCGDLGSLENYYVLHTAALTGVLEPAIA